MVDDPQMRPVELSSDTWAILVSLLPGGGPNAGLIRAGEETLLIDTSMSPAVTQILKERVYQITGRFPTYLINTHCHGDHIFGNQVFSPPAVVIAHENVRTILHSQGQEMVTSFAGRWSNLLPDIGDTIIIPPHITYRDHMTLHFGGREVKLIHPGPAHTDGDTLVYLPAEKILFSGDMFFDRVFPPIFGSSTGWISALEKLEKMEIDTVIPGHGEISTKKDISEFRQSLMAFQMQVRDCFQRGLSPEGATREVNLQGLIWPLSDRLEMNVRFIYRELRKASGV